MFNRIITSLLMPCFLSFGLPSLSVAANASIKCWAKPPVSYKIIKPIAYLCGDASEKIKAETGISRQVNAQRANEKKLATQRTVEKEKKRKLAERQKEKALTVQLNQQELVREEAAIAASEVKQAEISNDIMQKMLLMCEKYWSKGEHRCYCQKYIEHAPKDVQEKSTCE